MESLSFCKETSCAHLILRGLLGGGGMRALLAASDCRCALFILPCVFILPWVGQVLAVVMSCRLARWCVITRRVGLMLDAGQNLRHSLQKEQSEIKRVLMGYKVAVSPQYLSQMANVVSKRVDFAHQNFHGRLLHRHRA